MKNLLLVCFSQLFFICLFDPKVGPIELYEKEEPVNLCVIEENVEIV